MEGRLETKEPLPELSKGDMKNLCETLRLLRVLCG